ncbi:MAG: DUF1638 domain-containing protein [Firmicutes bacterium]|nr:DUF1638 domain-containing protein [Bacillota bacterium]
MHFHSVALVICEAIAPEVEHFLPSYIEPHVIEFGLHNHPGKLNERLRAVLRDLEEKRDWDAILFGYGRCADGVVGLKAKRTRLVLPKVDDCIPLFLGSKERYCAQAREEAGTFYLTKGWIENGENPLSIYLQKPAWTKKYPPEVARWTAREIMKNYSRVALVNTGSYCLEPYIGYARRTAETFGLKFEIVPGSLEYLQQLLGGPWNDERFLVLGPGEAVTKEMFYDDEIFARLKSS